MISIWGIFFISALLIIWSGTQLTYKVDSFAEERGLSRGWLGFVLLASITSLPEFITTIYSSAGLGVNDQAIGNIFGSNLFNVLIFVIIGFIFSVGKIHSAPETGRVSYLATSRGNFIAGLFYIFLTSSFMWWVLYEGKADTPLSLWKIDYFSFFIIFFYFVAAFLVWKNSPPEEIKENKLAGSNGKFYLFLFLIGGIIVVSGIALSWSVKKIAIYYNISFSFAGAVFLAIVTSLPELVVSISSISVSSPEMAHGNILGSNLFNLVNLSFADIFSRKGSIFWHISTGSQFLVMGSLIVTTLMMISITTPPRKRMKSRFSWITLLILLFYFVTIYASWLG